MEIIEIRGAFYSGAGAIADFLKGADEILSFGGLVEFAFLRDECGLLCLLDSNIDAEKIENFAYNIEHYAEEFGSAVNRYYNFRLADYDRDKYKRHFITQCVSFLANSFPFSLRSFLTRIFSKYTKFFSQELKDKILKRILLPLKTAPKSWRLKKVVKNLDQRVCLTKKTLDDIFSIVKSAKMIAFLGDTVRYSDLLSVKQCIFVTRDPRDAYCSYTKRVQHSGGVCRKYHHVMRAVIKKPINILTPFADFMIVYQN